MIIRDTRDMSFSSEKALEELTAALARLRQGDYGAAVSFAGQDGALGQLGAEFNQTVQALRERQNVRKFVHDIKNPLAGIAGAIEIIAHDLPAGSPSRDILPELKAEIEKIKQLLSDFAQGK